MTIDIDTPPPATAVRRCPPDHKHHSTGTCYVIHKCRCDPCRQGHRERESRRNKLKAYGRYDHGLVDATPTREHIEHLRAHGIGYKTIADRAGVSRTAVRMLIYGREDYTPAGHGPRHGETLKRISRTKAEKILAIKPTLDNLPKSALVPARATVRRVQALVAFGWSQSKIAHHLGMHPSNLGRIITSYTRPDHKAPVKVKAQTALAMVQVYERLAFTPPPRVTPQDKIAYARARRYAAERRWPLPMDWAAANDDFDRPTPVRRSA